MSFCKYNNPKDISILEERMGDFGICYKCMEEVAKEIKEKVPRIKELLGMRLYGYSYSRHHFPEYLAEILGKS